MKPIRTPEDHSALLAEIAALMDAKPGTPEADRLEILAVLASEYERRELPPESDPVDLLALVMRGKGLSQAELSEVLGSRAGCRPNGASRLHHARHGRRRPSRAALAAGRADHLRRLTASLS